MLRVIALVILAAGTASSSFAAESPLTSSADPVITSRSEHATSAGTDGVAAQGHANASKWPTMTVHKSPTCPCCAVWVQHMRAHGFHVVVNDTHAVDPIRRRLGVPAGKGSCHTAEIKGLVIEGHVPAHDVQRFLTQHGDARGLVVPGMPIGSPGMEAPDGRVERYTVERIEADGTTTVFATHGGN